MPISGGANIQEGLQLLPAFLNVYLPQHLPSVWLTKVYPPTQKQLNLQDLRSTAKNLSKLVATDVNILPVRADSVVSAIVQTAETHQSELLILGASGDGLLKRAWHGNIPEQIANKLSTTVIIIRLPPDG